MIGHSFWFFKNRDIVFSFERSTDQVIKPVNLDALTKWVGTFSEEIVQEMASIAPMLAELGFVIL